MLAIFVAFALVVSLADEQGEADRRSCRISLRPKVQGVGESAASLAQGRELRPSTNFRCTLCRRLDLGAGDIRRGAEARGYGVPSQLSSKLW